MMDKFRKWVYCNDMKLLKIWSFIRRSQEKLSCRKWLERHHKKGLGILCLCYSPKHWHLNFHQSRCCANHLHTFQLLSLECAFQINLLSSWEGDMEREQLASLPCCLSRGEMFFPSAGHASKASWRLGNEELCPPSYFLYPFEKWCQLVTLGGSVPFTDPQWNYHIAVFLRQPCIAQGSQRRSPPGGWISLPRLYSPGCVHVSILTVLW